MPEHSCRLTVARRRDLLFGFFAPFTILVDGVAAGRVWSWRAGEFVVPPGSTVQASMVSRYHSNTLLLDPSAREEHLVVAVHRQGRSGSSVALDPPPGLITLRRPTKGGPS